MTANRVTYTIDPRYGDGQPEKARIPETAADAVGKGRMTILDRSQDFGLPRLGLTQPRGGADARA